MNGMDRSTGKPISGRAHLAQSIADILTTPIGTRCMRRDYGSIVPELIDQPMNPLWRLRMFAATAVALSRWEPRLRLTRVGLAGDANGKALLEIDGEDLEAPPANSLVRLAVPLNLPLAA